MTHKLSLIVLDGTFAVCRLSPSDAVPSWAQSGELVSWTRTGEELSIICPERDVPDAVRAERGWGCLKVRGPLDFSMVGVLAVLTRPLAEAGLSLFALSTFDTDYLLLKEKDLDGAKATLAACGHTIISTNP